MAVPLRRLFAGGFPFVCALEQGTTLRSWRLKTRRCSYPAVNLVCCCCCLATVDISPAVFVVMLWQCIRPGWRPLLLSVMRLQH